MVNQSSWANQVSESKSQVKPFDIPKSMVWEAYQRVKANKGAAGVDGQSVEQFGQDEKNNLYRLWNRMSSGSVFPAAGEGRGNPEGVGGRGQNSGVPTVADRIAQTVVAMYLERLVEPVFHPDSYGVTARGGRHWTRWRYAGKGATSLCPAIKTVTRSALATCRRSGFRRKLSAATDTKPKV